jgi:hypothetical protein
LPLHVLHAADMGKYNQFPILQEISSESRWKDTRLLQEDLTHMRTELVGKRKRMNCQMAIGFMSRQ